MPQDLTLTAGLKSADRAAPRRRAVTPWERKLAEARARRRVVLGETAPPLVLTENDPETDAAPSPDAERSALWRGWDAGAELWARWRGWAPLVLAFVAGIAIGWHIVAGPRAQDPGMAVRTAGAALVAPAVSTAPLDGLAARLRPSTTVAPRQPELPPSGTAVPTVLPEAFVVPATVTRPDALGASTADPAPALPGLVQTAASVRVGAPASVSDGALAVLGARLDAAAKVETTLTRVNFTISATHVRFFHTDDAEIARTLAEASGGGVRDFTDFSPKPAPGTLELYVAGTP